MKRRHCEVCGAAQRGVLLVDFGTRLIALCAAHARAAAGAGVSSPAGLRDLFKEELGQRSLLERRAPDERRLFPPRPEGRRLRNGRRASDHPGTAPGSRGARSRRATAPG